MNKSDYRIKRTNRIITKNTTGSIVYDEDSARNSVEQYPTPHPCDDGDTPQVPDKPTPNPDRPKRKGSTTDELIYTNGVQKKGNVVSVKVNTDSTNYMRTGENGLSIKFLIDKLECIRKTIKKLNENVNQLKDEVQPSSIAEKMVEISKEFEIDSEGNLGLKLGEGLEVDENGRIGVKCDGDTIGFNDDRAIMTIWVGFDTDNGE